MPAPVLVVVHHLLELQLKARLLKLLVLSFEVLNLVPHLLKVGAPLLAQLVHHSFHVPILHLGNRVYRQLAVLLEAAQLPCLGVVRHLEHLNRVFKVVYVVFLELPLMFQVQNFFPQLLILMAETFLFFGQGVVLIFLIV